MKKIQTTLLFLLKENQILLGMKKRGFGAGKYNGIGGKLEPDETVEQAMVRETQEEIGVTPTKYQKHGVLDFDMYYKGEHVLEVVHIFTATEFDGEPQESDEMRPTWFMLDKIPLDQMYQTDAKWLPLVLEKRGYFEGLFRFTGDLEAKLVEQKLELKGPLSTNC